MHQVIERYKLGARTRNLPYELTIEKFVNLSKQPCFYCGAEPSNVRWQKDSKGTFIYNGLDRINNDLGYILNNVVPCCIICNKAKATMTQEVFLLWVKRIYKYRNLANGATN